jgi:GNAT superfamily N-acetyltransferase
MAYSTDLFDEVEKGTIQWVRLTKYHKIKPFDCGNEDLNTFLMEESKVYIEYLYYTTFLFENLEKTVAYYCLANDILNIDPHRDKEFESELDNSIKSGDFFLTMNDMSKFPAVKIGRLAVDKEFQKKGYGTSILNSLIASFLHENKTGCQFVTVDALNNHNTLRFYTNNGFDFVTNNDRQSSSRQMYRSLILELKFNQSRCPRFDLE